MSSSSEKEISHYQPRVRGRSIQEKPVPQTPQLYITIARPAFPPKKQKIFSQLHILPPGA